MKLLIKHDRRVHVSHKNVSLISFISVQYFNIDYQLYKAELPLNYITNAAQRYESNYTTPFLRTVSIFLQCVRI